MGLSSLRQIPLTFPRTDLSILRNPSDLMSTKNVGSVCCRLLQGNPMFQTQNSTKHRYSRLRARTFLLDVFTGLSAEIFLLCTLAVSTTDLSKIPHKNMFREWWRTAPHPRGLTETANELCAANSIGTLATPPKKRQSSEDFIGVRAPFVFHVIQMLTELRIHHRASVSNWDSIRRGLHLPALRNPRIVPIRTKVLRK